VSKFMKSQKSYLFGNTVFKEGDKSAKTTFSGLSDVEVGPAPEFEGSPDALNPEEMFVAAINNCLMTTFFYFVRKSNVEVLSYYSQALGRLEKQKDGFRFTHVEVRAEVTLPRRQSAEKVRQIGDLAEKYCLISRSVACPVHYELQVKNTEN
jgi:organic hydroperoxide reductase OsmC/OhrA